MTERRKYRPGSRNRYRGDGQISEGRVAWVRTVLGQFIWMEFDPSGPDQLEESTDEPNLDKLGPNLRLVSPRSSGRPISWNLSALTEEELDILVDFFKQLEARIRPIIRLRDKVAQDAWNEGNDSYYRIYREVPQFVVRERAKLQYSEGILHGSDDDAAGLRDEGDPAGRVLPDDDELADGSPKAPISEDDAPSPDKH